MDKELFSKWIAALRSGNFKQANGRLRKRHAAPNELGYEYHYCCLGVLCEISGAGIWSYDVFISIESGRKEEVLAPQRLAEKVGFTGPGQGFENSLSTEQMFYAAMNDEGADFNTIADALERNLLNAQDTRS